MRRALLATLIALAAAGCSNEGLNPIVGAAIDEVNPMGGGDAPASPGQQRRITRESVTRADVATIRARLVEEERPTYLLAASNNGGYITYASALRQTITLAGTQITATRGLGFDLLSATSSASDPLRRPVPVTNWPAEVTRSFEFPANGPRGRIATYSCRFERGEPREIVILEQRHRGIEMTEICTGPDGSFENLHLADAATGQVWRSLQWTGPRQGLLDLEIVLPYTGR